MDEDKLREIEERRANVKGPWDADETGVIRLIEEKYYTIICFPRPPLGDEDRELNMNFIAHAPSDIDSLLAALRECREERDRLRARLEWIAADACPDERRCKASMSCAECMQKKARESAEVPK